MYQWAILNASLAAGSYSASRLSHFRSHFGYKPPPIRAIIAENGAWNIGLLHAKIDEPLHLKFTGVLRFKEAPAVEVLAGCWPPDLTIGSMVLKPGESTTIESTVFMMHPGMDGKHDYGVHLKTNDPNQPDFIVHVLSDWGP